MTLTKKIAITEGPILPSIVRFAIPLVLASIVQLVFNAVDIMVLGHMADTVAVASVGVTSAVTAVLVNTFIGLGTGTNIILSRYLGARDRERTRQAVDTSIVAALVIGVAVAFASLLLSPAILTLTDCPPECRESALLYLRIYLFASPFILIYNFGATVIRVSGDSHHPLIYIICAGLLNVVLNFVLCLILPQKVAAVAIATFASQALSAILVIVHLLRMEGDCRMNLRHLCPKLAMLGQVLRYGLPTALTHSLYQVPNLMIQSSINAFGPAAITGNTAAANLEGILSCAYNGIASATTIFVGQNLGAGKNDRVRHIVRKCLLLDFCLGMLFGILGNVLGELLLGLYIPGDTVAIAYGIVRMRHISLFLAVGAVNSVLCHVLNAFGYPTVQTACSVFSILGLRVFWMLVLFPLFPSIQMLYFCYTVSWWLQLVLLCTAFLFVWRKFRRGTLHEI